jgi:RNA polymerase sigma-70 factor, ECF subfamily
VTPAKHMDDGTDERKRPALRVVPGGGSLRPGDPDARGETHPGRGEPVAPPAAPPDDALVAAFLVGDDAAFGELVRRNQTLVLAIVRRYARTPEDARDLAQRTFLKAFQAARRALRRGPRAGIPFRRWLVRVAVNLAKNHLRDETRFTRAPLDAIGATPADDRNSEPLLRAERALRLRREVLRLPQRQREVLTLRIDAELPFAEIAAALGITENAAKVTFHHASRRLRERLAREDRA